MMDTGHQWAATVQECVDEVRLLTYLVFHLFDHFVALDLQDPHFVTGRIKMVKPALKVEPKTGSHGNPMA